MTRASNNPIIPPTRKQTRFIPKEQKHMITKAQLRADKDGQNRAKYEFDLPWDETSLSRLYDKIDNCVECGSLADIISAVPLSFDKTNNTIKVEVTLGLDDIFDPNTEEFCGKDVDKGEFSE